MSADLRDILVAKIREETEKANAKAEAIGAATTDRKRLIHDIMNPAEGASEVPEVAEFNEWLEKVMAKVDERREVAEAAAKAAVDAKFGEADTSQVDALKAEHKEIAEAVRAARKFYLVAVPGATEEDLKDLPSLKTLRGGTAGGGSGSKRPRLQYVAFRDDVNGPWTEASKQATNAKGEDVTVTSFTVLANALKSHYSTKVEVKDLQAAAFAEAGTEDLSEKGGEVIEYAITVGEKNVFVKIQPKSQDED